MPITSSQHTEKEQAKRRYHGEAWASIVAEYLNSEAHDERSAYFRTLVSDCRALIDSIQRNDRAYQRWFEHPSGSMPKVVSELLELLRSTGVLLQDLRAAPHLMLESGIPGIQGRSRLFVEWRLAPDSPLGGGNQANVHSQFLYALVQLIEAGTLSKLECCTCQKYFFKKFSHQKFCSPECRIRENQSTEEAREYRRRKQREYYHLQKNKNVK